MKEKIMNIKNLLKIIISIFVIFSMIKSCSQAITSTKISELEQNLTVLENKGILGQGFVDKIKTTTFWTSTLPNSYYGNYVILVTNESVDNVYIALPRFDEIRNYTNSTNSALYNTWGNYAGSIQGNVQGNRFRNKNSNQINGDAWTNGALNFNSFNFIYAYSPYVTINTRSLDLNAGEEYNGNYINGGLDFTTSTDYITVNIGNETKTDVIRTHKKSTIENPIWRNNRKLQRFKYLGIILWYVFSNAGWYGISYTRSLLRVYEQRTTLR